MEILFKMPDIFEKSRDNIRDTLDKFIINPIIFLLIKIKVSPNFVTILGFLVIIIAAYYLTQGMFRLSGLLILFAGFMDIFDGALARRLDLESNRGALLDSVLDRLSEALVLIAAIYFFSINENIFLIMTASLCIVFSLMISYLRARIEGLGFNSKGGIFTRPERILVVSLGFLLFTPSLTLQVLVIGSTLGFINRFYLYWRLLKNNDN